MEQTPPRRRPPRQKLKMPLFGNLGGGASNSSSRPEKSPLSGKITPIAFLIALVAYGVDYVMDKKNTHRTITGASDVKEMVWNGKVTKKWANVISSDNIHYYIEMTKMINDTTYEKNTVDLVGEKTDFWDKIGPNNTLVKKEGDLNVTVKRFFKKDTVLTLKY
ncbi:hypothetical protein [Flectobacillus major]|jgi:hypothetical protein|uniref:hypothetical protein n=1 Tax=Flectobacillus major TaxID=103 RepID=UPI000415D2A5|nr:hypothetical protein [Flectobacillus major]